MPKNVNPAKETEEGEGGKKQNHLKAGVTKSLLYSREAKKVQKAQEKHRNSQRNLVQHSSRLVIQRLHTPWMAQMKPALPEGTFEKGRIQKQKRKCSNMLGSSTP